MIMGWQVLAAIAATITVIINITIFFILPAILRNRRKAVLLRISELKDEAIELQNNYDKFMKPEGSIDEFSEKVHSIKKQLLDEIAKISKPLARQFSNFGAVDISMFLYIERNANVTRAREWIILLGVLKRCWELADKIAEKYS